MPLLPIFLVFLISFLLIKYKLYKIRLMKYVKHLPSLPSYPLIGSGYIFIGKNTKDIYNIILKLSETETPATLWLGPQLNIIIAKPEDLQTVLLSSNCLDKPYVYRFLPNERGLLTSEAHVWKPSRKLLNPTFNIKILRSFIPIFNKKSKLVVQKLKLLPDNATVDVSKLLFESTLEMVCATSLGYDSEIHREKNREFLESLESIFQIVAYRSVRIWLHPSWIYKMTPSYQICKRLFKRVSSLTEMIKDEKRREYDAKNKNLRINEHTTTDDEQFSTPQILINELFKLSTAGKISEYDITEQINTMLVGGNETSALVLSHTILMLSMYPAHQEKVFDELNSICNSKDSDITFETISQLSYMEMVIKEVMRLFPVGPVISRNCLADTAISNCTIPKGSFILMSITTVHRNPKYWGEHPERFDPDNFLPERVASRHPYAYLPFSGGTRNCIGMRYAWMSIKILLANLLLNFKFSTELKMEDLDLRWDLTLKMDNKQLVTVEKRI